MDFYVEDVVPGLILDRAEDRLWDPGEATRDIVMKTFYVYIVCSAKNGTLYIGVTSNLERRINEHRNKKIPGFTAKYSIARLVYYEEFQSILVAIKREKQLKWWERAWKLELIEKVNPAWKDLYEQSLS